MTRDVLGSSGSDIDLPAEGHREAEGPLGLLPKLSARQVRVASRLSRLGNDRGPIPSLDWLRSALGISVNVGTPDLVWRASGLRRSGMVAELHWPRLSTRLAIGLATPLAHGVVDRLLGFDRLPEEGRLPISPVEWGILTYAVAETISRLANEPAGPFGAWDVLVDRIGPDPFDLEGLGRVVTIRWPVSLGEISGALRLWLPESLLARWLTADPPPLPVLSPAQIKGCGALSGQWRADAGSIALARGLKSLRIGGVLPLDRTVLSGSPENPVGPIPLILDAHENGGRFTILTKSLPQSGAGRLMVVSTPRQEPTPREAVPLATSEPKENTGQGGDVPVTLAVELGRINLTLSRLADLRPGDVVQLGRHSHEPVELTSAGRIVARGELVKIDTELGVRITNIFL